MKRLHGSYGAATLIGPLLAGSLARVEGRHPLVHASAASAKTVLRLDLRARRRRLAAAHPEAADQALEHLPPNLLAAFPVVSGYRARGAEFDSWPLMRRLAEAGASLALPVARDGGSALVFRRYALGDPLTPDAFGIPAPLDAAPEVEPDLVIAPVLAFDRTGARMGQGAGHYDRTLSALRARRPTFVLGLAYADQELARVPTEPHDQPLDAILTETAYIDARRDP